MVSITQKSSTVSHSKHQPKNDNGASHCFVVWKVPRNKQ